MLGASTRAPRDPGATQAPAQLSRTKDRTWPALLGMVPWPLLRPSQQACEVGTLYSHLASEETEVQRLDYLPTDICPARDTD